MFPGALLSQWSKGYYTCRLFVCFWLSGSRENACLLTPSTHHHHHDHHLVTLPTFVLVVLQMFPCWLASLYISQSVGFPVRPPVTGCAGAGTGFARVIKEREFARWTTLSFYHTNWNRTANQPEWLVNNLPLSPVLARGESSRVNQDWKTFPPAFIFPPTTPTIPPRERDFDSWYL